MVQALLPFNPAFRAQVAIFVTLESGETLTGRVLVAACGFYARGGRQPARTP